MEYKKLLTWKDLSDLGLIYKINKEVLHPLGLAMTREQDGTSKGAVLNDEPYQFSEELMESNNLKLDNIKENIQKLLVSDENLIKA